VIITLQGQNEASIESIAPRRNLLYRSDAQRSKQFAANVDQLLIVVATEPSFSDDLVQRALVGACAANVDPCIVLNKIDRPDGLVAARERLAALLSLGIPVIETCARDAQDTRHRLMPRLTGRSTLLLGQSGMGKSTLLNALVPEAGAREGEHSQALDAGRHTTTTTRLYSLASGGSLIDSPGFQAFGLGHLSPGEILAGFPDLRNFANDCRFYNCSHRHEPGCGVLAALALGQISPQRHALYQKLLEEHELTQARH
jgi:ribosome biogenesis GTPase